MRTSKPIATISYNSEKFLNRKLGELVQKGIIDFFAYINHLPEEDDKQEHKHLFIVPSGIIDCNQLRNELVEVTSLGEEPEHVMPFRNSKFADWYLYVLHDKNYLDSKLDTKKYHYAESDLHISDYTYFNELKHVSDFTKYKSLTMFKQLVASGMSFGAIVERGVVPMNMISQYKMYYDTITCEFERRKYVIDKSTGVVRDSIFK